MITTLKKLFLFTLIICFITSCDSTKKLQISEVPVYNFEELEPLLYTEQSKITIVNFWAMWCAPCVKELPYLQEYANKNANIELLLVSLDFPKDIDTQLKPFLLEQNITTKVVLLDDPDSNTWIDKIDPNWSGAIPFTIIFNHEKRLFYERPFENINDLENEIYQNFN
ncbi:redoxin domain-containing protein [Winogradskyella eckloniae]|uniref:TlpA family protein disulfide reductase n=1 Tax=Winogradskyella eckloniae TaxID=1089306 RepID=UPI00156644D3|nr:TlpA family protein disulfide reductase [Winogradskyella eckloniae]NRD19255.1 redoxin domain-containing protein [Winogradskyella eckloniae]